MTERSRRSFLRTAAVGGALTSGAVLLPSGLARAATATPASPRFGPVPQPRATTYRLRVVNNSDAFEQFAVYQNDPDLGVDDAMSLAWFVKGAHPGQHLYFEWTIDYSVMWSESGLTGDLGDGVKFVADQEVPVDPSDSADNRVELDYVDGIPLLRLAPLDPDASERGDIYVAQAPSLPDRAAGMIGIGIGGAPAYAAPAAPNRLEIFTPHPNYWIVAGTFEAGAALDVEKISSRSQSLPYTSGVTELSVDFDRRGKWTLS